MRIIPQGIGTKIQTRRTKRQWIGQVVSVLKRKDADPLVESTGYS